MCTQTVFGEVRMGMGISVLRLQSVQMIRELSDSIGIKVDSTITIIGTMPVLVYS